MLSIDAEIQAATEKVMDGVAGSVVVVDPNNGDIIAMASSPGYDLNAFVPGISATAWKALNEDPQIPLLNRAISGTYPPGSTFKMITAFAALVNGKSTPGEVHNCPGYFELGKVTFRCGTRSGHGPVNLEQAIEGSCNVYFFHIGLQAGIDAIYHMATAMGLGTRTGIELGGEAAGLVPNAAWKRHVYEDGWRDGDTCNVSIGQGALLVTPLQMALTTAAIANGGILYKPRLVIGVRAEDEDTYQSTPSEILNRLNWNRRFLDVVRLGMKDVIMSPRGTGRDAAVRGIVVAGKTGTAEFGRKEDRKRHAWMVAYAPYDNPQYAIAMLVDEGVSGGETAGPRMKQLLEGIFRIPPSESGGAG
jgi:penicillin-binding protein 2